MARHGDTRSPSPVGSSYSSSKRGRRDDDRYDKSRRDDGRSHRHRTRSRSPDVCERRLLSYMYHANQLANSVGTETVTLATTETARGTGGRMIVIARTEGIDLERGGDHEIEML